MAAGLATMDAAWFVFAALCGAVMSSFNSGINSASTIFTIDLYKKYFKQSASPKDEVFVGRQHLPMIRWILGGRVGPPPI